MNANADRLRPLLATLLTLQERLEAEWAGKIESNSHRNRERNAILLNSTLGQDIYNTTNEMLKTDTNIVDDIIFSYESGIVPDFVELKLQQVNVDLRKIEFNIKVLNRLSTLNLSDIDGNQLSRSIYNNDLVLFYILLQFIDPNKMFNPLFLSAVSLGYIDFVELLLDDGRIDPTAEENSALCSAIAKVDMEMVQRLLQIPAVREMALRGGIKLERALGVARIRGSTTYPSRPEKREEANAVVEFMEEFLRDARGGRGGRRKSTRSKLKKRKATQRKK